MANELNHIIRGLVSLSTANQPEKGRGNPVSYIIRQSQTRSKRDISTWRGALQVAEKYPDPRRYLLNKEYREALLDAHIYGQIQNRKQRTLSSRFNVHNKAGEADDQLTWLFKTPWFRDLLDYGLDALFWGHSLITIDRVVPLSNGNGGILSIDLIPRDHVCPEDGLLLKNPSDTSGIAYREFPDFQGWIIETPKRNDLGLLHRAVPHFIYKKFAQAGWSQYSELFGMPLRLAKTDTTDPQMIAKLRNMMEQQGSAPYTIIDKEEELEFIETTRGKGEVFKGLIALANSEISKLINGVVMGEADQGGSRSKEEVSERMQMTVTEMDKEYLEQWLNFTVFPILIQHGYPLEGAYFQWEEQKDIKELWRMTHEAMMYYDVPADWVEETFGIPIAGPRQGTPPPNSDNNAD